MLPMTPRMNRRYFSKHITWWVFVTETLCALCAVGTKDFFAIYMNFKRSVTGLPPRGPVSITGQYMWGQSGIGTDFSPSTSIFPCHYHSTSATHWYSSSFCSYEKARRKKPRNRQNSLTFRTPVSIRIKSVVTSSQLS